MYRLAPDRLHVGCTHDEMPEARKAAGTANRDLGQYGSKLQMAMTTRSLGAAARSASVHRLVGL
jgi:hypothetical protein